MDAKLKHLELLQSAIARMSNASFAFKGWSITLTSALLAVAVTSDHARVLPVAAASTLLFWALDGYYLWLERGFVVLYRRAVDTDPSDVDFNMLIDKDHAFTRWLRTCRRPHLVAFYATMLGIEAVGSITIGTR